MKTVHKKFPSQIASMLVITCLASTSSFALKTNNSNSGNKAVTAPSVLSACTPGAAQADLDINNVRAHFLTGGDMWWDYSNSAHGIYEVPKGSNIMPIYAGALWMGGYDAGNNLHVAAQEYRNGGNDWWPGPLDTIGNAATITPDQCLKYDHHYKITLAEVAAFAQGGGAATAAITSWPGNGNTSLGQAQYLAPFVDKDGDGIYNPAKGDYPKFDLDGSIGCTETNCVPVDKLFGDECLWWVINDKGDIHTETAGLPIGMEVHCQAFSFTTNDDINNMTFINYRLFNRSSLDLDSTFLGIWCDPDLGCATDDWVGCDVARGLGYVYNGTNNDVACSGELGYGVSPPALGIDFFRGPITNPTGVPGDGVDNNHNCQIDEPCEQAVMTHFVYYTNGAAYPQNDPSVGIAKEWYNYMSGSWQDGSPFVYGGTGYSASGGTNTAYCFPGSTDHQYEWGIGGNCQTPGPKQKDWSEPSEKTTPGDRRFFESAGPFKMLSGAVNVVTAGVVWARSTGGNLASVTLMQFADTKAQALFDNCFKLSNGPDAPDITIQELDKKLIVYLSNSPSSNNYSENYSEGDPYVKAVGNSAWIFQGYKLYQVKDNTVSSNDLSDPNKARLIGIYDIKDTISKIINYYIGVEPNPSYWTPQEMVNSPNTGVKHSIVLTTDLFALGDPTFINHKNYYFMAVAYGFNHDEVSADPNTSLGYNLPYIQSRRNIKVVSGIPHIPSPYTGGTVMDGTYGSGAAVTRIEGNGNGGNQLELTSGSISDILNSSENRSKILHYEAGYGPLNVRVVDPLNVPDNNSFTLKFDTTARIDYQQSSGSFKVGDTVVGQTSNYKSVIVWMNASRMRVSPVAWPAGKFTIGENITGTGTNTSVAKVLNYLPSPSYTTSNPNIDKSNWILINNTTGDTTWADQTIVNLYEQIIPQYGFSVSLIQPSDPGSPNSTNNGFITASMSTNKWLTGLADGEGGGLTDWIRSGTASGDYPGVDDGQIYENVIGGTWAPYRLCAKTNSPFSPTSYYTGPAAPNNNFALLSNLASVNVVFTSNKNLWTRCPVLEMCEDPTLSANTSGDPNPARKFDYRRAPSVDKNGNPATVGSGASTNPSDPNYISDIGMGWFPGYAINLETGERLNIAFGENSALGSGVYNQNGADMKWNPTKTKYDSVPWAGPKASTPVYGGQHYIYIFGHNYENTPTGVVPIDTINIPRYDAGQTMINILKQNSGIPSVNQLKQIYADAMWVNIPMLVSGHSLLESDVTVKLRVGKSYKPGYSAAYYKGNNTHWNYLDTSLAPLNKNIPMYQFSTDGIATHTSQHDVAVSALDLINVVPNPYYAYSDYETSPQDLDHEILITNLPEQCKVQVYNLNGKLIRTLSNGAEITNLTPKSSTSTTDTWHDWSLKWDLKNTAGTPVASGVYIIHVDVPGVGEKIVKAFIIMRNEDIGSF